MLISLCLLQLIGFDPSTSLATTVSVSQPARLPANLTNCGGSVFSAPITYSVGSSNVPNFLSNADLNNDGKLDLVSANFQNGNAYAISVLLGNGDGTFQAAKNFGAGIDAISLAIGDLNGDGKLDVATVAWTSSATVNVFYGNGDGTFQTGPSYPVGYPPQGVAIGDLRGNGKQDLVVISNDNTLDILFGNGDGTFQTAVGYNLGGSGSASVTLKDSRGNGKLDVLVAGYDSGLFVLLNKGDGTFQTPVNYTTGGTGSRIIETADLNHDNKPDLVIANFTSNSFSVFFGNGNGSFQLDKTYTVDGLPFNLLVRDFNNDGKLDVVTSNAHKNVSIFWGNGDGTFQTTSADFPVGSDPGVVTAGDFRGDGRLSLVETNPGSRSIAVMLNQAQSLI